MVDAAQSISVPDRRPRLPVFGTLGRMFTLLGAAPLFFFALSLVSLVPSFVRLWLVGAFAMQKFVWTSLWAVAANLVIVFFVYAAVSYVAIRAAEGARPPIGEAIRVGVRRYLPMLAVTILTILAVYAGMILLLVPGVMAACAFAVSIPVCAVEPIGPIECMRRSAALTKGSRWRILAIYLVYFLPLAVIGFANAFLVQRTGHPLAYVLVNQAVSLVTVPLSITLGAALYIELRRLKENVAVASVFD